MDTRDTEINLIKLYFDLLKNLNKDSKLELIARLSESMKTEQKPVKLSVKSLYGAYQSDQTADELIEDFKKARTFTRKREAL